MPPKRAGDSPSRSAAAARRDPPAEAESPWVRLRSVSYHPFLYARMIADVSPDARPGDVVAVYDRRGAFFGRGLYNPRSQIAVRMLRHGPGPVDGAFWRQRISEAVALRRRTLHLDLCTDAYRLVHAEGDGLSGLTAERYADHVVLEVFALGVFQRADMLSRLLREELGSPGSDGGADWTVQVRADERVQQIEGFRVTEVDVAPADAGSARPRRVGGRLVVREHGVRYRVDVHRGQKTGFFCDQRDNRRALAALCRDADVLDVCCYTGGFGLCARVVGGAASVTGVDLDEQAVALARENANLNQVRAQFVHADAFPYLRQALANNRQYDAVVVDPPKIVATRAELPDGRQRYLDLNKLALGLVRPGGVLLTCSCSGLVSRDDFLDVVRHAARVAGRRIVLFNQTGAAPDHPVAPDCPETAYLKALWLRVL